MVNNKVIFIVLVCYYNYSYKYVPAIIATTLGPIILL